MMKPHEIKIETLEAPESMDIWAQGDRTRFLAALPDLGPDQAPTAPVPVQWLLNLMADEITCREIIAWLYQYDVSMPSAHRAMCLMEPYKAKLHQIQADIARINLHNTKYQIVRQSALIQTPVSAPGRII